MRTELQMDRQTEQTQAYALAYWQAGLVPIPTKLDGSKAPVNGFDLDRYFAQRPERDLVASWFSQPAGIAVLMGSISDGAECIDFDDSWPILSTLKQRPTDASGSLRNTQGRFARCLPVFAAVKLTRRPDKSARIETGRE
jgi:hypothetical protein